LDDILLFVEQYRTDQDLKFRVIACPIFNHLSVDKLIKKLKQGNGKAIASLQYFLKERYQDHLLLSQELQAVERLTAAVEAWIQEANTIPGQSIRNQAIADLTAALVKICATGKKATVPSSEEVTHLKKQE
jgi:hypothetical protein